MEGLSGKMAKYDAREKYCLYRRELEVLPVNDFDSVKLYASVC
jgi:hypothetical protein